MMHKISAVHVTALSFMYATMLHYYSSHFPTKGFYEVTIKFSCGSQITFFFYLINTEIFMYWTTIIKHCVYIDQLT